MDYKDLTKQQKEDAIRILTLGYVDRMVCVRDRREWELSLSKIFTFDMNVDNYFHIEFAFHIINSCESFEEMKSLIYDDHIVSIIGVEFDRWYIPDYLRLLGEFNELADMLFESINNLLESGIDDHIHNVPVDDCQDFMKKVHQIFNL